MEIEGKRIGVVLTGSFCNLKKTVLKIRELIRKEMKIIPIMSYSVYNIDTKYGKAKDFINEIEDIVGRQIICTIEEAEQIGLKKMTDIMIILPCSRKYYIKISL